MPDPDGRDRPDLDPVLDALERVEEAFAPPNEIEKLDPHYPPDYDPEDRIDHVLEGEYPRYRGLRWIAAAADTDTDSVRSVLAERLAEGEVEISDEGVRRNRYHVYFELVREKTERVSDDPEWLR